MGSAFDDCIKDMSDNNDTICHPSCRTCTGSDREECLTCWCGAHRSNSDSDLTSTCECDSGYLGHNTCEPICVEGCDVCEGVDENECVTCSEGYILEDHTYGRCVFCDAEREWNPSESC